MDVDSAITVAFNRPVVPLVAGGDQAGLPQPLVITPTVQGKGEWVNTSMYRLSPDQWPGRFDAIHRHGQGRA